MILWYENSSIPVIKYIKGNGIVNFANDEEHHQIRYLSIYGKIKCKAVPVIGRGGS
jgi:hypothetical protein